MAKVTRVLLAQLGEDGDNDTFQAVARSLRDLGLDVVYGGLLGSPGDVIQAAMQEDVDVVGVQLGAGIKSGIADETASQLPGIKVVDLPQSMTVDEAVKAVREAGNEMGGGDD